MSTQKNHPKNINNKKHNKNTRKNKASKKGDFFYSVNHAWMKRFKNQNRFLSLDRKTMHELFHVVKSFTKINTPEARQVTAVYNAVLHVKNEEVIPWLLSFLCQLNTYRKDSETKTDNGLYPWLAWLKNNACSIPISCSMINDPKDPFHYCLNITEDGLGFFTDSFYKDSRCKKFYLRFLTCYFQIFKDMSILSNMNEIIGMDASTMAHHVFEIEKEISSYLLDKEDAIYIEKTYHRFSLHEMKNKLGFDLALFYKEIGKTTNVPSYVVINNPFFLKKVLVLMKKKANTDAWYCYWVYSALSSLASFHTGLVDCRKTLVHDLYEKTPEPNTKARRALSNVLLIMNATMSKKYIEEYKHTKEIEYVKTLFPLFQTALRKRLQSNTWLSQKTIENAIKKLDAMCFIAGNKLQWTPDPPHSIGFVENDAIGNCKKFYSWDQQQMWNKCGKHVPPPDVWINENNNVYDVNAFYENTTNSLIFPNAILTPPFVDLEKDIEYNLAYIGTSIGHEIMHAFDDDGFQYDANGEFKHWWLLDEKKKYEEYLETMKPAYKELIAREGAYANVSFSMGENIADVFGLFLAEDVLQTYLEEKGIYQQDKEFQRFYRFYAEQWRTTKKIVTKKREKWNEDVHLHPHFRVNASLSLSPRFQRIMELKQGNPMFYDLSQVKYAW